MEEGEVMQGHIVSIETQQSPHPFLPKRPLWFRELVKAEHLTL